MRYAVRTARFGPPSRDLPGWPRPSPNARTGTHRILNALRDISLTLTRASLSVCSKYDRSLQRFGLVRAFYRDFEAKGGRLRANSPGLGSEAPLWLARKPRPCLGQFETCKPDRNR